MCGRYALIPNESAWHRLGEQLSPEMDAVLVELRKFRPHFNAAPTQYMPIIVEDAETREPEIYPARWGFIPFWWKKDRKPDNSFNARLENCPNGPMWRGSWRHKRCLVPATLWYEWQLFEGQKTPWAFLPQDGSEMMLAGLWDSWLDNSTGEEIISFAIITQPAADSIADFHHRMPLILAPQIWSRWISPQVCELRQINAELARNNITDIRTYKVKRTVSNARNNGPECIEPDSET